MLEVEGAATSNAKLIVNHCPETQDKIEIEAAEKEANEKKDTHALIDSDLLQDNTYVNTTLCSLQLVYPIVHSFGACQIDL